MRARLHFIFGLGIFAACGGGGGGEESTAGTVTAGTPATMNPSEDTTPTGPGESDGSSSGPVAGAPVFLSLQTNVSKITAGESVIFTAVLTDPDGVDDIVGGTLSDASGQIGYGPFVAAGQEGTYSITVSWDEMQQAEAIQFEGVDLGRVFRAEFYDQGANKVQQDVDLTLTCAEGSACDGVCTDIMVSAEHCGACGKVCGGGCGGGQCAPAWGECFDIDSGFETCGAYCSSVGETCAENKCETEDTIRGYGNIVDCTSEKLYATAAEACDKVQTWGPGRQVIQCCCTDTK